MDSSTGIVPVMPMSGAGDGFGGSSFMWIFGLLILMSMVNGGFGGFGNNAATALGFENLATSSEVQRGFDAQNSMANEREILSAVNAGTAQAVAAANQVYHDVVDYVGDKYSELARDIAGVAVTQQQVIANQNECCGSTKMLIQATSANTDAQIAQSKYDTSMQMAQMESRILAKMDANKIEELQNQINQLQLAQATNGMLKFPNSWTYGAGPFPPIYGNCGCAGGI